MSKPVRLRDHLHAEIERLAKAEKRSTANMVELLLEQAVKVWPTGAPRQRDQDEPGRDGVEPTRAPDPYFKPDFK